MKDMQMRRRLLSESVSGARVPRFNRGPAMNSEIMRTCVRFPLMAQAVRVGLS